MNACKRFKEMIMFQLNIIFMLFSFKATKLCLLELFIVYAVVKVHVNNLLFSLLGGVRNALR